MDSQHTAVVGQSLPAAAQVAAGIGAAAAARCIYICLGVSMRESAHAHDSVFIYEYVAVDKRQRILRHLQIHQNIHFSRQSHDILEKHPTNSRDNRLS